MGVWASRTVANSKNRIIKSMKEKRQSKKTFTEPDSVSSTSSVDSAENFVDLPDGKHKYKYKNGDLYYGDWKDGMMHGRGTLVVAINGVIYEGFFVQNEFNGKGVYIYNNGNVYKGEFVNGYRHGKGKMDFADGRSMKGIWANGKKVTGNEQRRTKATFTKKVPAMLHKYVRVEEEILKSTEKEKLQGNNVRRLIAL
jgi:hypothetical protein